MSKRSEPSPEVFISESPESTRKWGRELARKLGKRACIVLIGNLGAGKTTLVKGIAEELGIDPNQVTSPTFVLIREHQGSNKLIHADAYRALNPNEFLEVGLAEYFEQECIVIIEWGEKLAEIVPLGTIQIELEVLGPQQRKISVK